MKVYKVAAQNENEAHQRAWDAWNNTEIILDLDDFEGAEMYVLDNGRELSGENINISDDAFIKGYDYYSEAKKGRGTAKNGR